MDKENENQEQTLKKNAINNNSINTFCRLRPNSSNGPSINYLITNKESTLVINEDQTKSNAFKAGIGLNSNINNSSNKLQPKQNTQKQELITKYSFTKIFQEKTSQTTMFTEICYPIIEDLLSFERSSLIFAYGLSNSGKTHTIIGNMDTPGILPLSLIAILEKTKTIQEIYQDNKTSIECLYVEIYNEEIFDLLSPKKSKVHLKEKDKIFYLVDTTVKQINSIEDFNSALNDGILRKIHSSTKMNSLSSRSHTIFKIIIKDKNNREASLSIVDLAGAERNVRTETKGKELYQAGKINQSLMVLGRCIDAMEWNTRYVHGDKKIPVPIRESKLTKIFQEYFTGEQNVTMITTINLNKDDLLENKSVLSYSCKAKRIQPIKSWVSRKTKEDNKENINITMLMTGYNSDTNSDIIENSKLGVSVNNEQFNIFKDQYSSLVNRYENSIDEVEYLKDKNSLLINQMKNLENDYIAREYNAIIGKGKRFIMETWNNISQFRSNFFSHGKSNKTQFTINNPLYKKVFEEIINIPNYQYETCNENIEIIQEKSKAKTLKEIADSFSIVNMINKESNPIIEKKYNKKSKVIYKKKGYFTSSSAIEEENTAQVNKDNQVLSDSDSDNNSIDNDHPSVVNKEISEMHSDTKATKKKIAKEKEKKTINKTKKFLNDLEDINDSSNIKKDEEDKRENKGKNNKKKKNKTKKKIQSDLSFEITQQQKAKTKNKKNNKATLLSNDSYSKMSKYSSNIFNSSVSSISKRSDSDKEERIGEREKKGKSKKTKAKSKRNKSKK